MLRMLTAAEKIELNSEERIFFRDAKGADVPGIWRVRTSVSENLLSREQLAERGITEQCVAASLLLNRKGWIAECEAEIVGLSIVDRQEGCIFALFVLPAC